MFLILGLSCIESSGADWKFIGGSVLQKSEKVIAYYDVESVESLSNGNVRAWTKAVSISEVERVSNLKEVIEKSAEKVAHGYYPPYVLLNPKTKYDDYINIIGWEEAANYDGIKPQLRTLLEVNCKEKMLRDLSTIVYKKNGMTASNSNIGKWDYISPETNSETLLKILCKDRK